MHTDEVGIVGDGGAGSKCDITDGDDSDDRAYTSAEGQEDMTVATPPPLHSQVSTVKLCVCVCYFHVCKWPHYIILCGLCP